MKKKTYTLDAQEQELGSIIDQSIRVGENIPATPTQPINPSTPIAHPSVVSGSPADTAPAENTPPKKIMKNIWVPPTIDSKVKVIRAYRKAQGMEATFDAVANEAIAEYVQNHINEAIEWGSIF